MRPGKTDRTARARRRLLVTAAAISAAPLAAQAQTVAGVDASVGGMVASNPYFIEGSDTSSAAANVSLRPYISLTEDDTTVTVNGVLNLERYFDNYGTDLSAQAGASLNHYVDERTTVSASVGYATSDSAARHFYGGADLGGLEPGEFPDTPVIDPTLGNLSGRTSRLNVNLGLEQRVSTNSTVSVTAAMGLTRVESNAGSDYRDTSSGLAYSRQLNERTSLLLSLDVGYADYFGRRSGDGLFATALAGVDHKFTESMYGSIQAGLSYAAVNTLLGREEVTNWAASVDLCDMLARGTLCVTGSRSAQPTSLGGVTMVSSLGVSYARTFGTAGTASLGASYSKTGLSEDSPILLGQRESEVASVTGSYSHRIGERLSAFVTPSYSSRDDEFSGKQDNYQVMLGISYHFGKLR